MGDRQIKILLVEDEKILRDLVKPLLEKNGCSVVSLPDPRNAYKVLEKEKISLIISGIMMPHQGGLELLKELKASPKYKEIPFILWSNLDPQAIKINPIELGAAMYLYKRATTPDEFAEKINKFIKENIMIKEASNISPGTNKGTSTSVKFLKNLIFLGLLLLAGWFYWFQYRPAKIRAFCDWSVKWGKDRPQNSLERMHTSNYDFWYEGCLHRHGLK